MKKLAGSAILLWFLGLACKVGPGEPDPPRGEYLSCPLGTTPWGREPVNANRWWCELPDGAYHGPYTEHYPPDRDGGPRGWAGDQIKVLGWYSNGQRSGQWTYWSPDGSVVRQERLSSQ